MSNNNFGFNITDLAAVFDEDNRAGIVIALRDQLQLSAGKITDPLANLSTVVRKRVEALQGIQEKHDELKKIFFEERAALEAKFQKLYEPLYDKRYKIVNGIQEVEGVTEAEEKGVPDFWFNALKNNEVVTEEIFEHDEGALKYLNDIKWFRINDPKGFKLEFYFDTNPYFTNSVLAKTYHVVEEDEPVLDKAIGTEIEWYPGKTLTQKLLKKKPKKSSKNAEPITKLEKCESFFNFFNPPRVPEEDEDIDDDAAEELQKVLEQDFDVGCTIRDTTIPHAVSWFTKEAAGYDFDYHDDEVNENENDEEEDEDEDDDKEDDDNKKNSLRVPRGGGQQCERPSA